MTACIVTLCNLCNAFAVLYVNRATCYARLQEWDQVEQECKQALLKEPAQVQVNSSWSEAFVLICSLQSFLVVLELCTCQV